MSETSRPKTRAELETQVSRALIHFEKEYMGRGPLEAKAYLLDDMILIRLKGVLTPAEQKLSESQRDRSAYLLKQVRNELLSSGRAVLEALISEIVGVQVQSVHTDISTKTGERIIVVTLQNRPAIVAAERGRQEETVSAGNAPECDAMREPIPLNSNNGSRRGERRRRTLT